MVMAVLVFVHLVLIFFAVQIFFSHHSFSLYIAVAAFASIKDKEPSPKPQISIVVHPPWSAVVSRDGPLYLSCVAKVLGNLSTMIQLT